MSVNVVREHARSDRAAEKQFREAWKPADVMLKIEEM